MSMEAKHPNFIFTVSQFVCGSGCVAGLFPLPYFEVSEWEYDTWKKNSCIILKANVFLSYVIMYDKCI